MSRWGEVLEELTAEAYKALGADADCFLAELSWRAPGRRITALRAERLWNAYWISLSGKRPDLFYHDFCTDIEDTDVLAYLYVRKHYGEFVPPLRLRPKEKEAADNMRERLAAWTGWEDLLHPPQTRLVRADCPILWQERLVGAGMRGGCVYCWTPGLRHTILLYEDFLNECRKNGWAFSLIGTLLHEEIHSAHLKAAGLPALHDGKWAAYELEELCTTLEGKIVELMAFDGWEPTRADITWWNDRDKEDGARLNKLSRLWPKIGTPELVKAISTLAISAVKSGSDEEVFSLLDSLSPRPHKTDYWRALLYGGKNSRVKTTVYLP